MRILLLFSVSVILLFSCKDPTKDVILHLSPDFYDYALSIQINSLVDPAQSIDYDGVYTIAGENASHIYSIEGAKTFRFNNGQSALMIDRLNLSPEKGDPVQFEVLIDVPGYRKKTHRIEVLWGEFYSEETIYLLPEDTNIEGFGFQETSSNLEANGTLEEPLIIDFESNTTVEPNRFTLELDSGVSFYDRQGNQLIGAKVDLDIVGYDAYSDNSTLSLPGSSLIQMVELDGVVQKSYIGAMPRVHINLSVAGQEVKSIAGGKMKTRISLQRAFNTSTRAAYVEGDSLDIASFDEQDQYWKIIGKTIVKSDSNQNTYFETELDNFSQKIPSRFSKQQVPVHINMVASGHIITKTDYRANSFDGIQTKLLHSTSNLKFDLRMDPALVLYARAEPERFILECSTGSGTFSSLNDPSTGKSIQTYWSDGSDTITAVLQRNPNSFVAYYTAFCEDQPRVLVYPPAGTKVFVKESGTVDYPLAPVHIVTEENKNNLRFETPVIEDGKLYDVKISYSGNDLAERFAIRAVYGDTIDVEIPSEDCAAAGF